MELRYCEKCGDIIKLEVRSEKINPAEHFICPHCEGGGTPEGKASEDKLVEAILDPKALNLFSPSTVAVKKEQMEKQMEKHARDQSLLKMEEPGPKGPGSPEAPTGSTAPARTARKLQFRCLHCRSMLMIKPVEKLSRLVCPKCRGSLFIDQSGIVSKKPFAALSPAAGIKGGGKAPPAKEPHAGKGSVRLRKSAVPEPAKKDEAPSASGASNRHLVMPRPGSTRTGSVRIQPMQAIQEKRSEAASTPRTSQKAPSLPSLGASDHLADLQMDSQGVPGASAPESAPEFPASKVLPRTDFTFDGIQSPGTPAAAAKTPESKRDPLQENDLAGGKDLLGFDSNELPGFDEMPQPTEGSADLDTGGLEATDLEAGKTAEAAVDLESEFCQAEDLAEPALDVESASGASIKPQHFRPGMRQKISTLLVSLVLAALLCTPLFLAGSAIAYGLQRQDPSAGASSVHSYLERLGRVIQKGKEAVLDLPNRTLRK